LSRSATASALALLRAWMVRNTCRPRRPFQGLAAIVWDRSGGRQVAGDWLKWVKGLHKRREVVAMAGRLGISRREVACMCMEWWEWCDENATFDDAGHGHAANVTKAFVDEHVSHPGFVDALSEMGWLVETDRGLNMPNLGRHVGQSAKERALAQRRQERRRESVTNSSRSERDKGVTREEKKREEKNSGQDETGRDDQVCASFKEEEWSRARELAREVGKVVRVKRKNRENDRSVILKACYLVASGAIPEHWLRDSMEAVKQGDTKKNTASYFHVCLENKAAENGRSLAQLLARVTVPPDFLAGTPQKQAATAADVDGCATR